MSASNSRSAIRLAATFLLVLLVGGCGGQPDVSTTAAKATTSTVAPTTVAPTTTPAPPPLTAKERAWLKAVPRVSTKIEKTVGVESFLVTSERMHSFANTLRSCRRELLGAGLPSDRLRPAYALVKKACAQEDKGARYFDTAAT